jgi:dTDP-glucose 4,6-dehydratase
MKLIVCGGAGFIGSEFVNLSLKDEAIEKIFVVDSLTYAGSLTNLEKATKNPKFEFLHEDIIHAAEYLGKFPKDSVLVNFAAESHVDNSISEPSTSIRTNVLGVAALLDAAMKFGMKKFIQVSTDEVYGPLESGEAREDFPLRPSSPYSASKASADLLTLAYWHTYKYPVNITRGANTFGRNQFPEKLIPLALSRLRQGAKVPIYGSGLQTREWIHVADHAGGILAAVKDGKPGEVYNLGSGVRLTNLEVIQVLCKQLGIENDQIEFVEDRKGHDSRYALNSFKAAEVLGWRAETIFGQDFPDFESW